MDRTGNPCAPPEFTADMVGDIVRDVVEEFNRRDELMGIVGDYDLARIRELVEADRKGQCFIAPFIAMVEQSLTGGEMKPARDQRFNGRYAVVYFDKTKWASPLIDICGKPYDREEAEARMKAISQKAPDETDKRRSDG